MTDRIRVGRDELFDPRVDEALARERAMTQRRPAETAQISPLRRLLMSSTFYLPAAGALATLTVWLLLEPSISDTTVVSGQVVLTQEDPLGVDRTVEAVSLTVGSEEVIALRDHTRLEPGTDGTAAFASLDDVEAGMFVQVSGVEGDGTQIIAMSLRPLDARLTANPPPKQDGGASAAMILLFPLTGVAIAAALVLAEAVSSRNWVRAAERGFAGVGLALVFAFVAFVPAGLVLSLGNRVLESSATEGFVTIHTVPASVMIVFTACRSVAWAFIGAAIGAGLNMARSTRLQLRNSVVGGALGGALGGLFFDPVSRFLTPDTYFIGADASRGVGLVAVGACVGYFVALVDQLAREAWLRVRTGPLAGKSFVIYRTPTTIGSSPRCDIYLFKDAEVEGQHALIHRVGNRFEIEDAGTRSGTKVGGRAVRRHRLDSGDQIVLGGTVLEFEERGRGDAPREGS